LDVVDVLNKRVSQRGISISELSRRVKMNDELLRRSLNGTRTLKATEFVSVCHELDLDIEDFTEPDSSV
jgi:ribosome-binding protein aMBF1 (putative translation factor)